MKKALFTAVIFSIILCQTAWAKVGDIVGYVYETDICTDFCGTKINSYNIGGETVIACEDLGYLGFNINWDAQNRVLYIKDQYNNPMGQEYNRDMSIFMLPEDYYLRPAQKHIYETDIKTYLNGRLINSYNLNGQTAIVCEDMRDYGYQVIWDEKERTLSISGNGELERISSDIGDVVIMERLNEYIAANTQQGTFKVGEKAVKGIYAYDYNTFYISLFDLLDIMGAQWTFDGMGIYISYETKINLPKEMDLVYNSEPNEKNIMKVYLDIYINGQKVDVVYLGGGSLLTNGHTYESDAAVYLYNSIIYIPVYTAEKIINS